MKMKNISYLLLCMLIAFGTTVHAFNTCDSPCCSSQGSMSHESMGQGSMDHGSMGSGSVASAGGCGHDMEWLGVVWNGVEGDSLTDGCNPQVVYQATPGVALSHNSQLQVQLHWVAAVVVLDPPDNTAKSFQNLDTTDVSARSGPPLYISNATFLC